MNTSTAANAPFVRWFDSLTIADIPIAGGKNASLGELASALRPHGIRVPDGFALTAEAYRTFLEHNNLEKPIARLLKQATGDLASLAATSMAIRDLFAEGSLPQDLADELLAAYEELSERYDSPHTDVAVRSSATAEDLPDASFAGQQETFLNVSTPEDLLKTVVKCFSSLFTERAISYRQQKGFDHAAVAISVGIQKMVRSDKGSSGVMFTIDTETGFPGTVTINAAYGLGETVVQGTVTPDEFRVFKARIFEPGPKHIIQRTLGTKAHRMIYDDDGSGRVTTVPTTPEEQANYCLCDCQISQLARWAVEIERHYGRPMDIEWALDGDTRELFIVQARPETVQSQQNALSIKSSHLLDPPCTPVVTGLAIGNRIATGSVMVLENLAGAGGFRPGQILVANQTDPDWVPLMRQAAAIITNHGGRTSHAAIVSRELDIPAIIGCGNATEKLTTGDEITVNCAIGQRGEVYDQVLNFEDREIALDKAPKTRTKLMLNIANPETSVQWWRLPSDGIGLARMEFIISNIIKIHPMALARFDHLENPELKQEIRAMIGPSTKPEDYFIDTLASGLATIAAPHYPNPVIVRMSDFKTNEYAHLLGGENFEPEEANPMLGFRGASRYYSDAYRPGFELECAAIEKARIEMGLDNIVVMIPFCRTVEEADKVIEVMAGKGLIRGQQALKLYVMAEIPSNIILAEEFSKRFDGFSIGSNDLTQLTLGCDRDSDLLAHLFDERNPAVKSLISQLIKVAHENNTNVGICGQAPSDYPDFVEFLVQAGIDSISVTPDSALQTRQNIADAEAALTHS